MHRSGCFLEIVPDAHIFRWIDEVLSLQAVEQEWDDAAASEAFGKLQTTVSNIIHGTVDEVDILQSQLDFAFEALPRSESDFVEAGVAILLAEQQKNL